MKYKKAYRIAALGTILLFLVSPYFNLTDKSMSIFWTLVIGSVILDILLFHNYGTKST